MLTNNKKQIGSSMNISIKNNLKISNKLEHPIKHSKQILKVISWNIEDFSTLHKILSNSLFLNETLNKQHLILIQEWKNDKNIKQGEQFISRLENFTYVSTDRVAVLYNTQFFNKDRTKYFTIQLEFEKPSKFEKLYTKGKQKSNILTILYPYNSDIPICVISFHLNAYIPSKHPGFHKKQLTKLITDSIEKIKEIGIKKYNIVIGGDTNYRIPTSTINQINLKSNLINKSLINSLNIHNVCNKKECYKQYTQSFSCVHEKSINKRIISTLSYFFNNTKIDIILTNLKVKNSFVNNNLCDLSDHSMILTELFL